MKDLGYYEALKEFKQAVGENIVYIPDNEFDKRENNPYTFSFYTGGFHYVRESEKNV